MQRFINWSEEDFYDLKLTKCFRVYCQKLMFHVLICLFKQHPKSEEGTLEVDEFYRAVKNYPKHCKKIKNVIKDWPEGFELNGSCQEMVEELNVESCLYFIKLVIYDSNSSTLPESILKDVEELIKFRNVTSHEKPLEIPEYHQFKEELLYRMNSICKSMDESLSVKNEFKVNYDHFKELVEKLWNFTEKQFVKQCHQILIRIYTNLYETQMKNSAFEEVFQESSERFANPLLFDASSSRKDLSYTTISYEDIFKNNNSAVVVGEAGSGKTTLCKKIVYSFCQSQRPFDFDLVLLIDVKNIEREKTLYEYLNQVFLKEVVILDEDYEDFVIFCFRKLRILFIIDDYDEKSKNSIKMIDFLFKAFGNQHFLVTTKCYFADNVVEQLKDHIFVKPSKFILKGLHDIKNLNPYLKRGVFPECWETYFNLSLDMKKTIKVPAITILLLYVIHHRENEDDFKTLTLTALFIQVHKFQSKIWLTDIEEGNSTEVKEFFHDICKYCFEMCKKPDSSKIFIDSILNVSKCKAGERILRTLFKPSMNLWNIDQDPFDHYEIIHESFFDYFAAYYIFLLINNRKENLENIFCPNLSKCEGVIFHLVGIMCDMKKFHNYFEFVMKIMEENCVDQLNIHNFLWEIMCQTMYKNSAPDKKLCNAFGSRILPKIHFGLDDDTVESGLSLLAVTNNYIPKEIKITLKNFVNKIQFERQNKKELSNTKLALKTSYYNSLSSFLAIFNPNWIKLVEFKGAVTQNDLHILFQFKCLEKLKIRLDLETLKTLVAKFNRAGTGSLKELCLAFSKPFSENLKGFKKAKLGQTTKLVIKFLEESDLSCTVHSLQQLQNIFNKKLNKAVIRMDNLETDEEFNKAEENLKKFRNLIEEQVTVKSKKDLGRRRLRLESALGNLELKWRLVR